MWPFFWSYKALLFGKKNHKHVLLVSFSRKILTRTGLTHVESFFFLLPKLTEHLLQFFFMVLMSSVIALRGSGRSKRD